MAEEKILNTRIQLKYDSYEAWQGSSVVLKAGEVAIAYLGPANKDNSTHASGQHPVLVKVGDGSHTFSELPWLSALAADVYAWAKKATPDWNDFPALPIEVVDSDTGKFVTNVAYSDNKITISRSDVNWSDVQGAPDFALKSELPTDFGVITVEAADKSLDVQPTAGDVKVKANISAVSGNTLRLESDGLYVPAPAEVSLPSVTDEPVAFSFVTETDQVNGAVSTAKAKIVQGDNITLTQSEAGADITITGKSWTDEIASALAEAKQYADDNDTNTAHTHTAGDGLKLTGNGGIDGAVDYALNLGLTLDNGSIVLHDKDDATKVIATLDAAELLEDSYLDDVKIEGNNLEFTWKMDDGSTKTDSVDLTHLVDVYQGHTGTTVAVSVSDYTVSAEVVAKSLKNEHIADDAAIEETKLAQGVQDALDLARSALQEHQDITGKADKVSSATAGNFAGLDANGNLTDSGSKASDFAPAADYALKSDLPVVNDGKFVVSGTGALTGSGEMTANQSGDSSATLDIADKGVTTAKIADKAIGAEQTKAYVASEGAASEEVWVFYCGSASVNI